MAIQASKIPDIRALEVVRKAGIPVPKTIFVKNLSEAIDAAKKIGWPVVLKISSLDILHKTEVGGIEKAGNEDELIKTYSNILSSVRKRAPKARISGVLVQQFCSGSEMMAGIKEDPQFGPVIAFGTGGIFVELLRDLTFRLVPINRQDAKEMISEIKGYELLKGFRGKKPANIRALENCLLNLSVFAESKKIKEMDINPLFVNEKGVIAADVRIIM